MVGAEGFQGAERKKSSLGLREEGWEGESYGNLTVGHVKAYRPGVPSLSRKNTLGRKYRKYRKNALK